MTNIAFIGLGIMGAPMARNLVRAGFTVTGFDLEAKAVARLAEDGGKAAGSIADAIDGAEIVITMLPADPHVEAVVLGEGGVFETIKPGTLFIDFSTIKPETSQKVAEAGARKEVRVLDAPVSGGEAGAVNAVLSIMAGGPEPISTPPSRFSTRSARWPRWSARTARARWSRRPISSWSAAPTHWWPRRSC